MAETLSFDEATIERVMDALDSIMDEPIETDWEVHLRKCAIAAIFAAQAVPA